MPYYWVMSKKKSPIERACEILGSQAALAAVCKVKPPTVNQWMQYGTPKGRPVPILYCVIIEMATEGEVKRWDLRPDDWYLIWPELIGAKGAPAVPEIAPATEGA
jgi:DNA-binding transcriptional regulator YdaS (Cro superfamily)